MIKLFKNLQIIRMFSKNKKNIFFTKNLGGPRPPWSSSGSATEEGDSAQNLP